ncbi:hypothetical protein [Lentzea aerocolonigenes]|uniref:hypothetical protein n=1 Tax=Lentzea aerocolonigenes TaxID=68170 RepID=UPI0004C3913C|nr:hypothetical protein [Lentzea aerocolonigenes]MCP2241596.1 hypothetical protein [Lentzea aerocolonigenes]
MLTESATVKQWLALSHNDLVSHVDRLARERGTDDPIWTQLTAHPVLAARVRGILSALRSADHRPRHVPPVVFIAPGQAAPGRPVELSA